MPLKYACIFVLKKSGLLKGNKEILMQCTLYTDSPMLAEDTDRRPTHWDDLPRPVDVPDGQNEQGVPRQVTITDRELEPLVPAER